MLRRPPFACCRGLQRQGGKKGKKNFVVVRSPFGSNRLAQNGLRAQRPYRAADLGRYVCAEMRHRTLEPSMVTYNAAISACYKGPELRRTFDVFAVLRRQAIESAWTPTVL